MFRCRNIELLSGFVGLHDFSELEIFEVLLIEVQISGVLDFFTNICGS